MSRKWMSCRQLENIARRNNDDLGFEWQLLFDRGAQNRFADIFTHNECADGADVNDAKLLQLLCDFGGPAPVRRAHVHRAKENNRRHASVCTGSRTCGCNFVTLLTM